MDVLAWVMLTLIVFFLCRKWCNQFLSEHEGFGSKADAERATRSMVNAWRSEAKIRTYEDPDGYER